MGVAAIAGGLWCSGYEGGGGVGFVGQGVGWERVGRGDRGDRGEGWEGVRGERKGHGLVGRERE